MNRSVTPHVVDPVYTVLCAVLCDQPVDWPALPPEHMARLADMAQAHGVTALLWDAATAHGWLHLLPPAVRSAIQSAYYQSVAQQGLIYQELARMLAAIDPIHSVIVLKGAALGPTVYGNALLRPISDLDLLVPSAELARINQQLEAIGYAAVPELAPGVNQRVEYHSRLSGGLGGSVAVEVHWRVVAGDADWRSPDPEWFWQQTEPWQPKPSSFQFPAAPHVRQLTPTAHLLYLAAHLMLQHGSAQPRLIWLYDLHLLITRLGDQIDWQELILRAQLFRWSAALAAALLAAQTYLGTSLPPFVLAALHADADAHAAEFIAHKASTPASPIAHEWIKLRSLDPAAQRRFIWSLALPSPTYIRWRYGRRFRGLSPLLYLLHWGRLVGAIAHVMGHATRRIWHTISR